jgi:hypothetical protein
VTSLLWKAFEALGPGANKHEIELVADTLRTAGDEETLRILEEAAKPGRNPTWEKLADFAEEVGAGPFVALDLVVAAAGGELLRRSTERWAP